MSQQSNEPRFVNWSELVSGRPGSVDPGARPRAALVRVSCVRLLDVVERQAERDRAFRALVIGERPGLVAASAMIVGNRGTAEEIVQDVLERTYKRWARVCRMDRPGAWVRRAVVNQSISAVRRDGAEFRALVRLGRRRVIVLDEPEVATPEIWLAVRNLPDSQAAAIALHYGADLPISEVAVEMGTSEAAVKSLLHRARQALRRDPELQEAL